MDDAAAEQVMARFASAFFSRDPSRLKDVITEDAEWDFALGADTPHGRVRRGLDGFMQGMGENDTLFERLRFDDVQIRAFGDDQLVMTYTANGKYRDGDEFALRGVELITVESGRVARKDVFWKQFQR